MLGHYGAIALVFALGCSSEPAKIDNGIHLVYSTERSALDPTAKIVRARLRAARVTGTVAAERDQLVVDLEHLDPEMMSRTRDLIGRTARFEVKAVDSDATLLRDLNTFAGADTEAIGDLITPESGRWHTDRDHVEYYLTASDRRVLERYLEKYAPPIDREFVFERIKERPPRWRSYLVVRAAKITPAMIDDAVAFPDLETNRPTVRISLDDEGKHALAQLTRAGVGNKIALILDDRVMSAPIVMEPITNGKLTLTFDESATPAQARELAIALASGALPAPLVLESVTEIKSAKLIEQKPDGTILEHPR